jgi:hypothetical protein
MASTGKREAMLSRYEEIGLLQGKALVAFADIARLEAKHETPITVDKFIEILEKTLEEKKTSDVERARKNPSEKRAIRPSEYLGYEPRHGNVAKDIARARLVEDIKQRLLSGRLSLLDALDECLLSSFGQHGPNSFKYKLLCNLFDRQASHLEEANETVAGFIEAISVKKEMFNQQIDAKIRAFITGTGQFLKIKTDTFVGLLKAQSEDEVSESESSEAPKPSEQPATFASLYSSPIISFTQTTYKEQKQKGRDKLLAGIEQQLNEMKISNLDALYKALTLPIGQKGPHSVKFKLIYNLLKDQKLLAEFELDKDVVDANFANALVNGFIKAIEEENMLLEARKFMHVSAMLKFNLGGISVGTFVANCRELLVEKQIDDVSEEEVALPASSAPRPSFDTLKSGAVSLIEKSRTTIVGLKNTGRKAQVESILKDLEEKKITVPEAIYRCLTLLLGQKGTHSFKYGLLKRLFADLRAENDKDASLFVDRFAIGLHELVLQEQKTQHDARMTFARKRLAEKLPKFSLDSFIVSCQSILMMKFEENNEKYAKEGLYAVMDSDASILEKMTSGLVKGYIEDYRSSLSVYKMTSMQFFINKILLDLQEEKITMLDAIQLCLTLPLGQRGEHSFKYRLIEMLFGLDDLDAKHARDMLDCFVAVIAEEQERMSNARFARVQRMVERFMENTDLYYSVNLAGACTHALTDKKAERFASDGAKKDLLQSVSSLFSGTFKALKATLRETSIESTLKSFSDGKITLPQAFQALLTSSIGQHGQHSFKFKLLSSLFFKRDEADDACIETDDKKSASKLIDCFIDVIGEKVEEQKQRQVFAEDRKTHRSSSYAEWK